MWRGSFRIGGLRYAWLVMALLPVGSVGAVGFVPMGFGGSLGYGYSYFGSQGTASESASLFVDIHGSGFVWQPWFLTTSGALTLALARSASSSDAASNSVGKGGSLSLGLFPQSRFPFSLSYTLSDSRTNNDYLATSASIGSTTQTLNMQQFYYSRSGSVYSLSWNHGEYDSAADHTESDNYSFNTGWRWAAQSLDLTSSYSESSRNGAPSGPETSVLTLSHGFSAGAELSVQNRYFYIGSASRAAAQGGSSTDASQVSSNFSWSPAYRRYRVGGGVSLYDTRTSGLEADRQQRGFSAALNFQTNITRHITAALGASYSVTDSDGLQTMAMSQNASLGYGSPRYLLAGFDYFWNTSLGLANSSYDAGTRKDSDQSATAGYGHGVSRSFVFGTSSSFSTSFSQGLSYGYTTQSDEYTWSANHSAAANLNSSDTRGSSSLGVGLSDTVSSSTRVSRGQFFNLQASRSQSVSRFSTASLAAGFQSSRSLGETGLSPWTRSLGVSGSYSHQRFLGVYGLPYDTSVGYSKSYAESTSPAQFDWQNRFSYSVGLLRTSFQAIFRKSEGGPLSTSLSFQATRSF